jgi:hypothetical protein
MLASIAYAPKMSGKDNLRRPSPREYRQNRPKHAQLNRKRLFFHNVFHRCGNLGEETEGSHAAAYTTGSRDRAL